MDCESVTLYSGRLSYVRLKIGCNPVRGIFSSRRYLQQNDIVSVFLYLFPLGFFVISAEWHVKSLGREGRVVWGRVVGGQGVGQEQSRAGHGRGGLVKVSQRVSKGCKVRIRC